MVIPLELATEDMVLGCKILAIVGFFWFLVAGFLGFFVGFFFFSVYNSLTLLKGKFLKKNFHHTQNLFKTLN